MVYVLSCPSRLRCLIGNALSLQVLNIYDALTYMCSLLTWPHVFDDSLLENSTDTFVAAERLTNHYGSGQFFQVKRKWVLA